MVNNCMHFLYLFLGKSCEEDVDECLSFPCYPSVLCTNTLGSYKCGPCPQGYEGDGKICGKMIILYILHLLHNNSDLFGG